MSDEPESITKDALFIWAVMHGYATVLQTDALGTLELPAEVLNDASHNLFERIRQALTPQTDVTAKSRKRKNS